MSIRRDPPFSLAETRRFLSKEECEAIGRRVLDMARGGGKTLLQITSEWFGEVRWARNRTSAASDRRANTLSISREVNGSLGQVGTNQIDDDALLAAVRAAERLARELRSAAPDLELPPAVFTYPETKIWSPATYAQETGDRAREAAQLMDSAETAGMLSAGRFAVAARGTAVIGSHIGPSLYFPQTMAECSTTVRDAGGTGSGWAGASSYDLTRVTPKTLGARALTKCLTSRNPVAIEPGRYTLIMEPQAVHALALIMFMPQFIFRHPAELGNPPWFDRAEPRLAVALAKYGQKVVDERITIEHDPSDPELGIVPFTLDNGGLEPFSPVKWIDRGVLTTLAYNRGFALRTKGENVGAPPSYSFRMSGGTTSVDEMIRTTKRGLLVTRFWGVSVIDTGSMLSSGLTRDGLWLIENGKISHPVKNLRFTESPLFAFNSIEQMGVPEPVYAPWYPAVVPALKVRDFSFTSLVDAI